MSGENGFSRNVVGLVLTMLLTIPAAALSNILLAQFLSVESRGIYALTISFAAMVATVAQLGWPSATIYALRRQQLPSEQVATHGLIAALLLSSAGVLVCFWAEEPIKERFLVGASHEMFMLCLAAIPLFLVAAILQSLARGINHFREQNAYEIALAIGTLLCVVGILVFGNGGEAHVLSAVLGFQALAVSALAIRVLSKTGIRFRLDAGLWLRSQIFGLKSYAMAVANRLHLQVDLLLIALLLANAEDAAFYAIAVGIVNLTNLLPEAIGVAAYPRLAELSSEEASRFACVIVRQSLALACASALVGAILLPSLIPLLYGEVYASATRSALVLLPGVAFYSVYRVLGRFYTALGRQVVALWIQVFAMGANGVLNFLLIPRLGFEGAAVASLLSYSFAAAATVFVFQRETGHSLQEILVLKRSDLVSAWAYLRARA